MVVRLWDNEERNTSVKGGYSFFLVRDCSRMRESGIEAECRLSGRAGWKWCRLSGRKCRLSVEGLFFWEKSYIKESGTRRL